MVDIHKDEIWFANLSKAFTEAKMFSQTGSDPILIFSVTKNQMIALVLDK